MLNDILRPSGNNTGGSLSLEFCPVHGLSSFPPILNSTITEMPEFREGFRFFKIEVISQKLSYDCSEEDTKNGPVYNIVIKGIVRGDSATLKAQFQLMARLNSFVVKVKDNSLLSRLAGNPTEYLKFSYKNNIGDDMGSLRSYSFQFSGLMSYDPPIYAA